MKNVGMVLFVHLFPRQGVAETRSVEIRGYPDLPDDDYGLMESYCVEAECNCRRVMINVASRRQQKIVASISYAFDRDDEYPGPFLDPLNPQGRHADALLQLVEQILADPDYVARLEAHYYQVKGMLGDPTHPGQKVLTRMAAADRPRPPRSLAKTRTRRRSR